jgi:hypothetical protein
VDLPGEFHVYPEASLEVGGGPDAAGEGVDQSGERLSAGVEHASRIAIEEVRFVGDGD